MLPEDSIEIRKYKKDNDEAYLYSTWLRCYKHYSYFAKRIRSAQFFKGHEKVIKHLLAKPNVIVLVACPKDDDDTILGYLAFEEGDKESRPVIHFTFVKDAFRKMGVAKSLFKYANIDPNNIYFTHWVFDVDELIKRWDGMLYDPYKL